MLLTKKHVAPSLHGLDVRTLRLFNVIASTGNLTRAAQTNHLAVGAASRRISNFEAMIGQPLFERSSRGLLLTAAGQRVAEHVENILDTLNALSLASRLLRTGVKSRVRILGVALAILQNIPAILSQFRKTHPDVLVEVEEARSHDIVRALLQQSNNIGIIVDSPERPIMGLPHFQYRSERILLLAQPSHPLAHYDRVRFEDTLDYEYIGHTPSGVIFRLLNEQARSAGKTLRIHAQVTGVEAACRMVAKGLGLTVAPEDLARSLKKPLHLKLIELDGEQYVLNLTVVHNHENMMTDTELRFLEYLRNDAASARSTRRSKNKHL